MTNLYNEVVTWKETYKDQLTEIQIEILIEQLEETHNILFIEKDISQYKNQINYLNNRYTRAKSFYSQNISYRNKLVKDYNNFLNWYSANQSKFTENDYIEINNTINDVDQILSEIHEYTVYEYYDSIVNNLRDSIIYKITNRDNALNNLISKIQFVEEWSQSELIYYLDLENTQSLNKLIEEINNSKKICTELHEEIIYLNCLSALNSRLSQCESEILKSKKSQEKLAVLIDEINHINFEQDYLSAETINSFSKLLKEAEDTYNTISNYRVYGELIFLLEYKTELIKSEIKKAKFYQEELISYCNTVNNYLINNKDIKLQNLSLYNSYKTKIDAFIILANSKTSFDIYKNALEDIENIYGEIKKLKDSNESYELKINEFKIILNSYNSVKIKWSINNSFADSIKLFVKLPNSKSFNHEINLNHLIDKSTNSYIYEGMKTGKEYSFYFEAKDTEKQTVRSEVITIKTTLTSSPKLAISKISDTKLKLKWTKVEGATRYIIYRKRNTDFYKKVLTLGGDELSYVTSELPKGNYTFIVKAARYDSKDRVMSKSSNEVNGTSTYTKPSITLTPGEKQIKITWTKVEGVTHYDIYRSTSKDGKYTKIATTKSFNYVAKSLKSNKTYYFKIRGYKSYDNGKKKEKIYTSYSNVKYTKAK